MKFTLTCVALVFCASTLGTAQTADTTKTSTKRKLGVVATAHLDTQWRWTIKESILDYIPKTFLENEKLFKKYPDYVFSFEGAFRYQLLKEYYPDYYARLKQYVAEGRWRVCGSWVDAVDVNIPSFESLVRQTLYGNGFFKQEFGKTSRDIYLPDCFGFGYALPSIAHHCGLRSFSTQKLSWGSSVDRPFDIGLWKGVDGSTVIAGINPGSYGSQFRGDLSRDTAWLRKIDEQNAKSGVPLGYAYFGTGDQGGSPDSLSVDWLHKSMQSDGPIEVHSIGADDIVDMVGKDSSKLKVYDGEFLLTRHGVGCYTSEAAMKRWNRKNEQLADAAERASVIATVFAGAKYPGEELKKTWTRFLWHQFHDDLTGTSIPEAYEYSWNDELLCQNRFASILTDAVSNIAPMLDTRTEGVPLIVYNPVSTRRQEAMTIDLPMDSGAYRVVGPDGKETPSRQQNVFDGKRVVKQLHFLAEAPSVGYAVYDLQPAETATPIQSELKVQERRLSNARYEVIVNNDGDVYSIFDKQTSVQLLSAPIQYQFLFDKPKQWPAWEIQYEDLQLPPQKRFVGEPEFKVIDQRPVRVGLEIDRKTEKSKFRLTVWLAAGEAGNKVEFENVIDWYERETLLKAAFALNTPNDSVTYDIGLGTIKRGLNTPKKYEVPGQQWADMTAPSGHYGVAILNDCKYGWDHPDAKTLRLSLIHTPGVFESWNWVGDQSSMDLGHHIFKFAIYGHTGDWREGNVVMEGAKFNQPLMGFYAPASTSGPLGKSVSLLSTEGASPSVVVCAVKKAEQSDELIVRLRETSGKVAENVAVKAFLPIVSAREVNGVEDQAASAGVKNGQLVTSFTPFQPKAFAIKLAPSKLKTADKSLYQPLTLDYNLDGISLDDNRTDGDIDDHGNTLAGELLPDTVWFEGVPFVIGPKAEKQKNVISASLLAKTLKVDSTSRVYLLALSTDGAFSDRVCYMSTREIATHGVHFGVKGTRTALWCEWPTVPNWLEQVGQWNNRLVNGRVETEESGMSPMYSTSAPVAWYGSHYHTATGQNSVYRYAYAYVMSVPLLDDESIRHIANSRLKILAATVQSRPRSKYDRAREYSATTRTEPAANLYDQVVASVSRITCEHRAFTDSTLISLSSPTIGATLTYSLNGGGPDAHWIEYNGPFYVSKSATVYASAFLKGHESEGISSLSVQKLLPHDAVTATAALPGLACKYYEGNWDKLPNFDSLKIIKDTVTDTIAVPVYAADTLYGLVMRGYIQIPNEGLYEFGLSSDDGSKLWIGDSLVVDNDGLHGSGELPGQIALKAGMHPLTLKMFQCKGDEALDLWITGPGVEKKLVPGSMLFHDAPAKKKGKR